MNHIKRTITLMDLNDIHYIARQYYIEDEAIPTLDSQQYRAQCFTKAVCTVLNIQGLEFPVKKNCEPLEDWTPPEVKPKEPPKK